jgi:osmotically-inducible protein OsmY
MKQIATRVIKSPSDVRTGSPTSEDARREGSKETDLAARVRAALQAKGYASLRDVRVTVGREVVVLQGPVRSYYLKQVVQETVLTVEGVGAVRNEIEVVAPVRPPERSESRRTRRTVA